MNLLPRRLTDKISASFDEWMTPSWTSPVEWADAGGLYYGNGEAWVYAQLPVDEMLADGSGAKLSTLLADLAVKLGVRPIHLALHSWERPATAPSGVPQPLSQYLQEAMAVFVPVRQLFVGVQLRADQAAQRRQAQLRNVIEAAVDQVSGEFVPDFTAYDTDRATVENVLRTHSATPISGAAADQLESWWALGHTALLKVAERDDGIQIDPQTFIEAAAVAAFSTTAVPRTLPLPGIGGATVYSVRGTLPDTANGKLAEGSLMDCSVILARRGTGSAQSWPAELRKLSGAQIRRLPLRQLSALDETLPCSRRRLNTGMTKVTAAELVHGGLRDSTPAGDRTGLLVGFAGDDFAEPCYLNPALPGRTVEICGRTGSGKTFLAEHLAYQAHVAGTDVVYITADTAPQLLADLPVVDLNAHGILDPYQLPDATLSGKLLAGVLGAADDTFDEAETASLAAGIRRAAAVGCTALLDALRYVDRPTAVVKAMRWLRKSGAGSTLVGPAGALVDPNRPSPHLPTGSFTLSTAALGGEAADRALVADLAAAIAVAAADPTRPRVIVVDGTPGGQLTAIAQAAQPTERPTHVILAHDGGFTRTMQGLRILLATDQDAAGTALAAAGLDATPSRVEWIANASPEIVGREVEKPALGLLRDQAGRTTSIMIAPVHLSVLTALTNGLASAYHGI